MEGGVNHKTLFVRVSPASKWLRNFGALGPPFSFPLKRLNRNNKNRPQRGKPPSAPRGPGSTALLCDWPPRPPTSSRLAAIGLSWRQLARARLECLNLIGPEEPLNSSLHPRLSVLGDGFPPRSVLLLPLVAPNTWLQIPALDWSVNCSGAICNAGRSCGRPQVSSDDPLRSEGIAAAACLPHFIRCGSFVGQNVRSYFLFPFGNEGHIHSGLKGASWICETGGSTFSQSFCWRFAVNL